MRIYTNTYLFIEQNVSVLKILFRLSCSTIEWSTRVRGLANDVIDSVFPFTVHQDYIVSRTKQAFLSQGIDLAIDFVSSVQTVSYIMTLLKEVLYVFKHYRKQKNTLHRAQSD